MNVKSLLKKSENYRKKKYGTPEGGAVVFVRKNIGGRWAACGWVNTIRDPNHWEPGCIAIDSAGNVWETRGGDNWNGAVEWAAIT